MSDETDDTGPAAYLIVLRHVLVAQDIAMTVEEFAPRATVIHVAHSDEALPLLDGVQRLAVAFVGEGPRDYTGSELERAVSQRGGRVVLIGEQAEAEGEELGYAVLSRPFSTGNVLVHLAEPRD